MVSASIVDGWRDILPLQETRPMAASVEPHPKQLLKARRIRVEFCDRCFNCLSYSHRVATCQLPRHCRGFRHLARDRRRPRPASTSAMKGANLPRHSGRDNPPASHHAAHGGAEGAAPGDMGGAGGRRRRRRRRRKTKSKDIGMGAPTDQADNTATSTTALCLPELDPLALALYASAGPPA